MSWQPFPLFQSHLDLAHDYWKRLLRIGDTVIDATCGNGHDTLALANLCVNDSCGTLYAIDKQSNAIASTRQLLQSHLTPGHLHRIHLIQGCHSRFPDTLTPQSVKLIVYNLGYLPGGNKTITTETATTLASVQHALSLLMPGGCLSITLYPGHAEGEVEQQQLIPLLRQLDATKWNCCHHQWINRRAGSPSLLLVQAPMPMTVR